MWRCTTDLSVTASRFLTIVHDVAPIPPVRWTSVTVTNPPTTTPRHLATVIFAGPEVGLVHVTSIETGGDGYSSSKLHAEHEMDALPALATIDHAGVSVLKQSFICVGQWLRRVFCHTATARRIASSRCSCGAPANSLSSASLIVDFQSRVPRTF